MRILLAEHRGFCYGVKRAVDMAISSADIGGSIHTLGPIIHNPQMVSHLAEKGITVAESVADIPQGTVIIRSHGVGPEIYREAEAKNLAVIDATCPHVKKAQQAAYELQKADYQVVIIGEKQHPEVKSILAWTDNQAIVVETIEEAQQILHYPRLGVVAQTTFAAADFAAILDILAASCQEIKIERTICTATDLRQQSALDLAKKVDIMIVVGGRNSANTARLASVCQQVSCIVHHIESAQELETEWFTGVQAAGITAGASTPDWVIEEVYKSMEQIGQQTEMTEQMITNDAAEPGSIVKGTIVSVRQDEVFVDIGYKAEGVIKLAELAYPPPEKASDVVTVGQTIDVFVIDPDASDGQVKLSKTKADIITAWDKLEQALANKQPLEVKITAVVKGGLTVAVVGVRGFIPASQADLRYVEDLKPFVGQTMQAVPIEVDREKQKAVLSRKQLLVEERNAREQAIFAKLSPGQTIHGTVSRLADFGAFVDIGGVDGLIHISDLSWQRVKSPQEVVNVGDEVTATVLKVDPQARKLSLSLKDIEQDPWGATVDTLAEGSVVNGKVTKIVQFGVFVELKPGIEGLVHISEIADHRIASAEEVVASGQQVAVKILSIDKLNKRISLSITQAQQEKERSEYTSFLSNESPSSAVTLGDKFGHLFKRED